MSNEDFAGTKHVPVTPPDQNDPPRFGQILETTKDAFVTHLREFFDIQSARIAEVPIHKYTTNASFDAFETPVRIIQEYPDIIENLPQLSVSISGGRNSRMNIGRPYVATVQSSPRLIASSSGPYALADGDQIVLRTKPDGETWTTSTFVLRASRFPTGAPITSATTNDLARAINELALYAHAEAVDIGGNMYLQISTGGPGGGTSTPNAIELLAGTSANVLTALGLTIGQTDDSENTERPPMNRYHMSSELTVNVDIFATDVNVRRELADLVYGWATFWLERQYFELIGRSVFDEQVGGEHYHIVLHQEVTIGGDGQTTARLNDGKDYVHYQRVTIPVTAFYYLDRPVVTPAGDNWFVNSENIQQDDNLPDPS